MLVERLNALLGRLLDESHELVPSDLVPFLTRELDALDFVDVAVYVADHEQRVLVPLPPAIGRTRLGIDSTLAGRVYQAAMSARTGSAPELLWMPIRDGVDRLGVMLLARSSFDDELAGACEQLTALVAQLLVSKNQFTDDFHVARRGRAMTLEAELRWSLLPPLSFSCDRVNVAAAFEPAYGVSGDAFDYALNGHDLHVGIFDGMGHDLDAARLTDLMVSAYRYCRRRSVPLEDTYARLDALLRETFGDDRFVTAQLAVLDTMRGELRVLNAGHPGPLLVRHGRLTNLRGYRPALPLGFGDLGAPDVKVQTHSLEPEDRLLFYTDGLTEARAPDGSLFGEQRLAHTIDRAYSDQHLPAEAVRRLMHALGAFHDNRWRDDATIVMVAWTPAG
jgi:serine phosphatase RsbU (regulator of sigma subunit)